MGRHRRHSADVSTEGGIDVLVNNSGGPKAGPALGQPASAWQGAFEAMALSIFAISDALLPGMIERGWGRVITKGSSGIEQPIAGLALSNGVRAAISAGRRRWQPRWRDTASPST